MIQSIVILKLCFQSVLSDNWDRRAELLSEKRVFFDTFPWGFLNCLMKGFYPLFERKKKCGSRKKGRKIKPKPLCGTPKGRLIELLGHETRNPESVAGAIWRSSVGLVPGPHLQAGTTGSQACHHVPRPLAALLHPLSSVPCPQGPRVLWRQGQAGRLGVGKGVVNPLPRRRLGQNLRPGFGLEVWGSVGRWHGGMAWHCGVAGVVTWALSGQPYWMEGLNGIPRKVLRLGFGPQSINENIIETRTYEQEH